MGVFFAHKISNRNHFRLNSDQLIKLKFSDDHNNTYGRFILATNKEQARPIRGLRVQRLLAAQVQEHYDHGGLHETRNDWQILMSQASPDSNAAVSKAP